MHFSARQYVIVVLVLTNVLVLFYYNADYINPFLFQGFISRLVRDDDPTPKYDDLQLESASGEEEMNGYQSIKLEKVIISTPILKTQNILQTSTQKIEAPTTIYAKSTAKTNAPLIETTVGKVSTTTHQTIELNIEKTEAISSTNIPKIASTTKNIIAKPSSNPINKETIFVYNAYLINVTTAANPSGTWLVRMPAFASCHHIQPNYTFGSFYLTNKVRFSLIHSVFNGSIWPMDGDCGLGWSPGCTIGPWIIDIKIPNNELNELGDSATLSYDNRSITIKKIHPKPERTSGLSICVAPMYWFADFIQLVEFVELWKILGASKIYFYYQSVTREVHEIFKEYEKMGIVEAVKSEVMPTSNETGYNPDSLMYRIGDRLFQNDCLMRVKTKFMAYIDVDEIFLPKSNGTVLDFLETEIKADSLIGGFAFHHSGLSFDIKLMPHLNINLTKELFDWESVNFSWLSTAHYFREERANKAVSMPDRVELINIHWIQKIMWPYKIGDAVLSKIVYYHQRNSWIGKDQTSVNTSDEYHPFLRQFFNENLIKNLNENYKTIMKKVETIIGRRPYPYYNIIPIVEDCVKSWRFNGKCSPYNLCYNRLWNVTEWIYANPSKFEAIDLIPL